MRVRLLLSFALVIFIALGSVFVVVNLTAEQQVRQYFGRSALAGVQNLVEQLQSYYQEVPDWQGVSSVFDNAPVSYVTPVSESPTSTEQSPVPTLKILSTTQTPEPSATPEDTSTPLPPNTPTSSATEPASPSFTPTRQGTGTRYKTNESGGKWQEYSSSQSPHSGEHTMPTAEHSIQSHGSPLLQLIDITPTQIDAQATFAPPRQGGGQGQGRPKSDHILTDSSGVILYSVNAEEIGQTVTDEVLADAIAIEDNGDTVAYLIPAGGVPDLPENYEAELIERIRKATLIAAIISGFIAILLALVLSKIIMRPVKVLTNAADNLSRGDLDQRVKLKGSKELTSLGNTFNQMANALQAVEQQRRAMTADIAHELRTPLAVQRANLEALQDGVYPLDIDALTPIIEQNRLLTRLVDDLRTLALMDAGELSLNIRSFDLSELSTNTISQFESMLGSSNIRIVQNYSTDLPHVKADPERVSQILHNLLQNAYRYSTPDTNVFIDTYKVNNMACLTIRDQGPGIPPDKIDKIFERFYRVGKGRDREKGGTGLGLSIARNLAEVQGGHLTADNHKEGGAIFTLSIPLDIQPSD